MPFLFLKSHLPFCMSELLALALGRRLNGSHNGLHTRMVHFPQLLLRAYSDREFSVADGQLILGFVAAYDFVFRAESKYPVPLYQSMWYGI